MYVNKAIEEEIISRLINPSCSTNIPEYVSLIEKNYDIFFTQRFRRIYKDAVKLYESNDVSYDNVSRHFVQSNHFEDIHEYLEFISNRQYNPQSNKMLFYLLRDTQLRRDLITRLEIYKMSAVSPDEDIFELLFSIEKELKDMTKEIENKEVNNKEVQFSDIETFIQKKRSNPTAIDGIATGIASLDGILLGCQKGDLILVAARPSMGKTAFALRMALNMAKWKFKTKVFSLEMNNRQCLMRLLSQHTGIPIQTIRTGEYDDNTARIIDEGLIKLRSLPISIDDNGSTSVWYIKNMILKTLPQDRPDIIFIDYIGIMDTEKGETREREVANTSKALKALAKELDIPIIVLSQLNRSNEARSDKRPIMSDLKDSGALEADADIVIFLHRPEYYGIKTQGSVSTENLAEVIVAKHRNGSIGTARLYFDKACTDFRDTYQY
jgi:replicative DNA helicase